MVRCSQGELKVIQHLWQRGNTVMEIATVLGSSKWAVRRALNRLETYGDISYRNEGHSGRDRKTTNRQDRYIVQSVRRRRTLNATQVNAAFREATGVEISTSTLRRRLHQNGLHARRRAACPALLPVHRAARRRWAQVHAQWGIAEWSRCLFTDECKFNLYASDGRILVWRERNERYLEECMEARVAFGGGGVTVWGGIMANGRTDLVVLAPGESMNALRYRDLCMSDIVVPFAQNFGDGFVLVDDNARPHRARIVQEFLRGNNVERMEWPARSPDMNVIEQVWSRMKLKLNESGREFNNLNELSESVRNEWEAIPQEFIRTLVQSMPRRLAEVQRLRGGPTKY